MEDTPTIVGWMEFNIGGKRVVHWCTPTLIWAVLGATGLNGMARVSHSFVISSQSWASIMVACLPAAYVEKQVATGYSTALSVLLLILWHY